MWDLPGVDYSVTGSIRGQRELEQELLEKTREYKKFMWIVEKYIDLYTSHADFETCWETAVKEVSKLTGSGEYESWAMLAINIHQLRNKELSRFTSNLYGWWCERNRRRK